jgi:SAM-dependent methyltransferase
MVETRVSGAVRWFPADTVRKRRPSPITRAPWSPRRRRGLELPGGRGGAGSIARWLSAAVGATGRVVVTDIDTRFLDELSGPDVTVVRHDITCDPLEREAFDLLHPRAVLEHVPGRTEVVERLVTALRPGGVLVLEDVVFSGTGAQVVETAHHSRAQ